MKKIILILLGILMTISIFSQILEVEEINIKEKLEYKGQDIDTIMGDTVPDKNYVDNLFDIATDPIIDSIVFAGGDVLPYLAYKIYADTNYKTFTIHTGFDGVSLQLGLEQYKLVRNATGEELTDGKLVRIVGSTGDIAQIDYAGCGSNDSSMVIGMTTHTIANNEFGFITTYGEVHDLNTNGIAVGAELWLGHKGEFTDQAPKYPLKSVFIGYAQRINANTGIIDVGIKRETENLSSYSIVFVNSDKDFAEDSTNLNYDHTKRKMHITNLDADTAIINNLLKTSLPQINQDLKTVIWNETDSSFNYFSKILYNDSTIYIDSSVVSSGDGSLSTPYKTLIEGLNSIPPFLDNVTVNVNIISGTHDLDTAFNFSGLNSTINIIGLDIDTLATPGIINQDGTDIQKFHTDITGMIDDQYEGDFVVKSGVFYPIFKNAEDSILYTFEDANGWTDIVKNNVYVNLTPISSFNVTIKGPNNAVYFQNVNIELLDDVVIYDSETDLQMLYSKLHTTNKVINGRDDGKFTPRWSAMMTDASSKFLIYNASANPSAISYVFLSRASVGGYGLIPKANPTSVQVQYIALRRFTYGLRFDSNGGQLGFSRINKFNARFMDCTYAISINTNSNLKFITSGSARSMIWLDNVSTFLYSDYDATHNINVYIPDNTIFGDTPTNWFLTSKFNYFVNPGAGVSINARGILYPEIETHMEATLTDNTTDSIQVGDTAQNLSVTIDYSATRSSTVETGQLILSHFDGVSTIDEISNRDVGLTFDVAIKNSGIYLEYITTSTGANATFKYNIKRIMTF